MRPFMPVAVLAVLLMSSLPATAQQATASGTAVGQSTTTAAPQSDQWRFRYVNNRWWYYQTNNRWVVWQNGQWQEPRAASYLPDSRVVQAQPVIEQQTSVRAYRRPSPTRDQVIFPDTATPGAGQASTSQSAADLSLGY
jgi:hypothetical protein